MCRIVRVFFLSYLGLLDMRKQATLVRSDAVLSPPFYSVLSENLLVYNALKINSNITGSVSLACKLKTSPKLINYRQDQNEKGNKAGNFKPFIM